MCRESARGGVDIQLKMTERHGEKEGSGGEGRAGKGEREGGGLKGGEKRESDRGTDEGLETDEGLLTIHCWSPSAPAAPAPPPAHVLGRSFGLGTDSECAEESSC